jgi:anti-sigma regulatory factor (Ser/Thr protein kinase)
MQSTPPALLIPMAADIGGLEIARLQARQFLGNHAIDDHTLAAVELVLEEAVTNVLRYGYEPGSAGNHVIEIDLQIDPEEVQVLVVDDGKPFDPLDEGGIVLPETLDEAQVGGLGLLMIRNTASKLGYERREGKNRFLMTIARHVGP